MLHLNTLATLITSAKIFLRQLFHGHKQFYAFCVSLSKLTRKSRNGISLKITYTFPQKNAPPSAQEAIKKQFGLRQMTHHPGTVSFLGGNGREAKIKGCHPPSFPLFFFFLKKSLFSGPQATLIVFFHGKTSVGRSFFFFLAAVASFGARERKEKGTG